MTRSFLSVVFALLLFFQSVVALADMDSPGYRRARQAYLSHDWNNALLLLKQYLADDKEFLSSNPAARDAVERAISYCGSKTKSTLIAGGVIIVEAPQPILPNPPGGPFLGQ